MIKVKIARVFRGDQETKFGLKPKVAIKVDDPKYQDKWISSFKVKGTEKWAEGMEVDINITQNGEYWNFDLGGGDLEARVKKLEDSVFGSRVETPAGSIQIDDVEEDPFA